MNEQALYPVVIIGSLIWYTVWFFLIGRAQRVEQTHEE